MDDDDFLAPSQFARTQQRSNSTNRAQMVTSSQSPVNGAQARASQPGGSRGQGLSQIELSQIQDGLRFLMDRVQQISGDSRGTKRPAEPKPLDNKPNIKEECRICHKLYANKTTLFRHYRGIHQEMNPEKYYGCSVNSTVVSLDASFREIQCSICGYVASTQSALDAHNRTTHSNEVKVNSNNVANDNVANIEKANNGDIKDKMHKCEECACYFEERSKFDEHMKVQHGFEVVCKICNKNLLFKDIDGHVKESHPDVYNKKRKEHIEKVIVEKVMKNKKGSRVHVFICTKCDIKMYDKIEAERHSRGHKKGLKIKAAPRNKVSATEGNFAEVSSNDVNVILTCANCDISTGSYDAAVEHSQSHITNNVKATQFVTQLCEICDLKFEPLCYKQHIDLHYKNKEIHRESFKYFKYKFELLPSENWFSSFDMAEPVVKDMIAESIYAHTRIVKMRVMHEGAYKLYKCCKCDDFVEPAAVLNHSNNYDTCVKVRCSYPCNICKRTFNNRLARNNHAKNHKSENAYKIVLFNHENYKGYNEVLNAYKLQNAVEQHAAEGNTSSARKDHTKVLYKCLCGLCFVQKETAEKHTKICPGKEAKKSCPKCKNYFNEEELLTHCFEHHLSETHIVIENITPDAIVLDSDEETDNNNDFIIVIDSSDEDDTQNECLNGIKIEVLKDLATEVQVSSENLAENVNNEPNMAMDEATLDEEKAKKDCMEEDNDEFREFNDEMTDDDSEDTISYEHIENSTDPNQVTGINKQGELKLVPTNLLLNPLHLENGFLKSVDDLFNTDLNTDIENVRQQIEMAYVPLNDPAIKEEMPWILDPTDFSNISRRRSLRQIEMYPSSSNLSIEVESLLTDDEETHINPNNDEAEPNDTHENYSDNNNSSSAPTVIEQTLTGIPEEILEINEMSNNTNSIRQNDNLNSIEETCNINTDNAHSDVNGNNCHMQEVILNNSTQIFNKDVENTGDNQDYSDDDLFLPSCNIERNNNQNQVPENIVSQQTVIQENLSTDTRDIDKTNVDAEKTTDPIIADNTEYNDSTRTESENYVSLNAESNTNQEHNDKVINDKITDDHDTVESGETLEDTPTSIGNVNIQLLVSDDLIQRSENENTPDLTMNIKKELEYININIKRELIEENERHSKNISDKSDKKNRVQIKTEPNDILDTEYNGNKEYDCVVMNKVNNDNYNNCSIV